jgi:hypothetical protein
MDQIIVVAGTRILAFAESGTRLNIAADANDFIGAAFGHDVEMLTIPTTRLGDDFLNLRTKVAGDVFQKFVNYRLKCAIVGDISALLEESTALRDFVRETNKGNAIWFVPDFAQLRARLERSQQGAPVVRGA